MKRTALAFILLVFAAAMQAFPAVNAEETFDDCETVYADSLDEALLRHDRMMQSGEIDEVYNGIAYALSDITGDGNPELIVQQLVSKHEAQYWIYGNDGSSGFYMGEFACDAKAMFGYREGVLYLEYYKGSVTLGLAEWDGSSFSNAVLYDGEYDADGDPPRIEDMHACYDPSRLLDEIPGFETVVSLAGEGPEATE